MSELAISEEQVREALDRIARTPDGRLLYLFLQKALTAVPVSPDSDALRELHGRRMFAAELMADMAKGIRAANDGRDPTDRPITFLRGESARVERRVPAREYIRAHDPELNAGGSGGSRKG